MIEKLKKSSAENVDPEKTKKMLGLASKLSVSAAEVAKSIKAISSNGQSNDLNKTTSALINVFLEILESQNN